MHPFPCLAASLLWRCTPSRVWQHESELEQLQHELRQEHTEQLQAALASERAACDAKVEQWQAWAQQSVQSLSAALERERQERTAALLTAQHAIDEAAGWAAEEAVAAADQQRRLSSFAAAGPDLRTQRQGERGAGGNAISPRPPPRIGDPSNRDPSNRDPSNRDPSNRDPSTGGRQAGARGGGGTRASCGEPLHSPLISMIDQAQARYAAQLSAIAVRD